MGKGDKKSKKGKRFKHSYGKTRPRKKKRAIIPKKKAEEKSISTEQQKIKIAEPELEKQVEIIESRAAEIVIKEPEVTEIKEEVSVPEIQESPVEVVPNIQAEPLAEEIEPEEPKIEMAAEDKPAKEAPKKRGRPKKKKEE